MKTILFSLFLIILAVPSFACRFNTDCYPGSKCVKEWGKIEGVCMGGTFPGNDYDNQRKDYHQRDYDDTWGTKGKTCSFNTDCGPGWVCAKGSGIYGTCVKR